MTTAATRMSNTQFAKFMERIHVLHTQCFELGKKVYHTSDKTNINTNISKAVVCINKAFQKATNHDGFYVEAIMMFALGYANAKYGVSVDFSVELDTRIKADVKVGNHAYQLKLGKQVFEKSYIETLRRNNVELLVVRTYNQRSMYGKTLDEAFVSMLAKADVKVNDQVLVSKLHDLWTYL